MDNGYYYEGIDMEKAIDPQTILADEMDCEPLPVAHDVPLRLRLESQLGYKMAKWVCGIEFVEEYSHLEREQGAGATTCQLLSLRYEDSSVVGLSIVHAQAT